VTGINAKVRRDINSPDFSTCLLLIQLVWVAVDITCYRSLSRVDMSRTMENIRYCVCILCRTTRRDQSWTRLCTCRYW